MIETWRCGACGYFGVDMKFYRPGKDIAVCPECSSEDIEIVGKYEIN